MGNSTQQNLIHNPFLIERYVYSLPLWRRVLARFFERFKVTREEYESWAMKEIKN